MSIPFEDILRKMGWADGFKIPVANKANELLEAEVAKLMVQKARATMALENENARYEALEKHMKYVKQESEQNQLLMTAHTQQYKAEEHKFMLTKAEKDITDQDIRKTNKTLDETETRKNMIISDLQRGLIKLEKMKSEMTWDEEALKAWDDSLKKRDEDNEMLKQFTIEDERKLKELEAKRVNLRLEYDSRKQSMEKMITDVVNYEQILLRTGKVFKQQRTEREALVKQWKETVKNLRMRDEAIDRANVDMANMRDVLAAKQEALDEEIQFLQNEIKNNKQMEYDIEEANFVNSKTRTEMNDLIQFVLNLSSEINTLNRTVTATANFLEKARIDGRNLDKTLVHKEYQIDELEKTLVELHKKYNNAKNTSMTSAERIKQMEAIIEMEKKQENVLLQDLERMQGVLYRSQQILSELKNTAMLNDAEIGNFETQTNLLRRQAKGIYNELQKHKEIIYDFDYHINQMESKLAKLEGVSNDEEIDELNKKITELEKVHLEHLEVKNLLQNQVIRIQDEMRRLTNTMELDKAQIEIFDSKLKEQILFFECSRKQCQIAKQVAQQKQVDENVLRLRVNQMEKAMKREDTNIYTLQKLRLELQTAMRERQIEISTNKEILQAKRRNLNEDKSRLKCDITSRHIRIDQWQKKYHIAMMALGKGDDGQPLSVTDFKIKNAQEKFMLQQVGDELDSKVRKAEKEIIAMENTLKIVNMTNKTYKLSLSSIDEDGDEVKEMKQLENEIRDESTNLRKLKKQLENKKLAYTELVKMYEELQQQKAAINESIIEKENEYFNIHRHNNDKQHKIERCQSYLKKVMRKLSNANINVMKYERDMEIRMLQDAHKNVLRQLSQMSTRYPEVMPLIYRYTSEYNLQLPGSKSHSNISTSSESVRSLSGSTKSLSSGDYGYQGVSTFVFDFNIPSVSSITSTQTSAKSKSSK